MSEKRGRECQEIVQATVEYKKEQEGNHNEINKVDTHISKKQDSIDNFSLHLNEEDFQKMYLSFRKDGIIKELMSLEEFKTKLENKTLQLNLNGPSLYYFHKMFKKRFSKQFPIKITLVSFITYFKTKKDDSFKYGTVRNGSKQLYPLHKELFEEMFV